MRRSAITSLACRACRQSALQALVPEQAYRRSILTIPSLLPSRTPLGRRTLTTTRPLALEAVNEVVPDNETDEAVEAVEADLTDSSPNAPWYLEVDPPRHAPSMHHSDLPKVPEGAPSLLTPTLQYVFEDMGLDEIALLDLRELDPPAALGPNLIMIFGTARSERHLHISSGRLVRWLKRNHKVNAKADGLIGPGELRTKLRRLRKKAKMMGTNTAIVPGGDNGISTGWVCVNFSISGTGEGEVVSFDESGRFAGFGSDRNGTTIVIQCLTDSRRNDLDLETLWKGLLGRSFQLSRKIQGRPLMNAPDLNTLLQSKVQLPTNAAALQWQALQRASEQRRGFSTTTRRLQPASPRLNAKATPQTDGINVEQVTPTSPKPPIGETLDALQQSIQSLQLAGRPLTGRNLYALLTSVLQAQPWSEDTARQRINLMDQLLLTAEERGMGLWTTDMLVFLIGAITKSPALCPELLRARKNLEFVLTEMDKPLSTEQVHHLMTSYAQRSDWDCFWNSFRSVARFAQRRDEQLYELAYRAMADTNDRRMCTEALRWVYEEMLKEDPAIIPVGNVYESLKACIRVADPNAEEAFRFALVNDSTEKGPARREFVKILREIEVIRQLASG